MGNNAENAQSYHIYDTKALVVAYKLKKVHRHSWDPYIDIKTVNKKRKNFCAQFVRLYTYFYTT